MMASFRSIPLTYRNSDTFIAVEISVLVYAHEIVD